MNLEAYPATNTCTASEILIYMENEIVFQDLWMTA